MLFPALFQQISAGILMFFPEKHFCGLPGIKITTIDAIIGSCGGQF
jgi:hypothetical protein